MESIRIQVKSQGAPIIANGPPCVVKTGLGFIAATIDMKSKYCKIPYTFSSSEGEIGFGVSADEDSLHLMEGKELGDITEVILQFYNSCNWYIFAIECERYTISIVLIEKNW